MKGMMKFVADNCYGMMSKAVHESEDNIRKALYEVETMGCTAMGPATLCSVLLAGQHQLGSNVVLCTDGEANEGLGSFNGRGAGD